MGQPLTEATAGPTRIVLDTDLAMGAPGSDIDDGFALALALADPDLRVEVVTTVGGNSDVQTSTRLTHALLEVLGRTDVPVVQGLPADDDAAHEIVRRVLAEPGELTLVTIGPLSNIARALELEPRVATAVREVVVMGGVYLEQTNVAAMPGEYNFWCDPEAAQAVLQSGLPLRLVGLDVTRRVRLTRADAERMADSGAFGRLAAEHTLGWIAFQERVKPHEEIEQGSCALHDPLAVAVVTRPELCTWRAAHVDVETEGRFTRGVAVADLLMWQDPPAPNCRIATEVDAETFQQLFVERLAGLP
ncbi:nucleoside hydrolase [Nocardioides anomalus]|uniref:Nucleoside hydrolase n=1 Tax=Nocardioides anomalus TaxID=2712223 RepID=A0A6G6WDW5_9ACTN|nr:nucleoside hydrolase [Nocardioides anomalus]QIG43343.1 nucleoside hydrolase [Nocardioides anomalus]